MRITLTPGVRFKGIALANREDIAKKVQLPSTIEVPPRKCRGREDQVVIKLSDEDDPDQDFLVLKKLFKAAVAYAYAPNSAGDNLEPKAADSPEVSTLGDILDKVEAKQAHRFKPAQ